MKNLAGPPNETRARRTQVERRSATIRKLLDAGAETLIEVGYAEASVQRICERAGLSQGALFRQFPSREALLVAVGRDVAERTLKSFRVQFAKKNGDQPEIVRALELVRAHARSRLNLAWYELSMAARTRPALREQLGPVLLAYHRDIELLAAELLPDLAATLGDRFSAVVDLVIALFDGESIERFVVGRPEADTARLALLVQLASVISEAPKSSPSSGLKSLRRRSRTCER